MRGGADKLGVFVSSTILECAAERDQARKAIVSVNHRPLLFESNGARPHPPREVYLRLLEEAHIFVGIYKNSYGWIGPGMSISGVEDEFRRATERGMPRLIYIHSDNSAREPRLAALKNEFVQLAEFTFQPFDDATDLEQLIRDDVTALVSDHFEVAPSAKSAVDDPGNLIRALNESAIREVRRRSVLAQIDDECAKGPVCLQGPLGSGKSVLLAQLCIESGYLLADCSNLAPKACLEKCAGILREQAGGRVKPCADIDSAVAQLTDAFKRANNYKLAIDDCERIDLILLARDRAGGINPNRSICFTSRNPPARFIGPVVYVAPFTLDELRIAAPNSQLPIKDIEGRSGGNPLYVRYILSAGGLHETSLAAYELRAINQLQPKAIEICNYIALSDHPLDLDALLDITASKSGVEEIIQTIRECGGLIVSTDRGYVLFHEHLRFTLRESMEADSTRHQFYAGRLADNLIKSSSFLAAYSCLSRANIGRADKLLARAGFEAARNGDIRSGEKILNRQIALSKSKGDQRGEAQGLLALSQLIEIGGRIEDSHTLLAGAVSIVQSAKDEALLKLFEERVARLDARINGSALAIRKLREIGDVCLTEGDIWSAARINLELSAIHIRFNEFELAVTEAETAERQFTQKDDEYGVALATRNRISAYVGSDREDYKVFGKQLLAEFERERDDLSPREIAWLLNNKSRQARLDKRPDLAVEYCIEAIKIGEDLGDSGVIQNNRVNLGNAYRDLKEFDEAVKSYMEASSYAAKVGDHRSEAHADMLLARVLNETDRPKEARLAALKGVAKARIANVHYYQARCGKELGEALTTLADDESAAQAYLDAARAIKADSSEEDFFWALLNAGATVWVSKRNLLSYHTCIDELVVPVSVVEARAGNLEEIEIAFQQVSWIVKKAPAIRVVRALVTHIIAMRYIATDDLWSHIAAKLVFELLQAGSDASLRQKAALASVAILSGVVPLKLTPYQLVSLAERLEDADSHTHFKPDSEGSGFWNIRLNAQQPIIVSIQQVDVSAPTFLVAFFIAAILSSLGEELASELLDSANLLQRELQIHVAGETAFRAQIDGALSGLPDVMPATSSVSRQGKFDSGETVSIVVICREDISQNWFLGSTTDEPNAVYLLVASLLAEIVYSVYGGKIDEELLRPKILRLIHRWLA
jgi:tetratricopeptide (TPR) repeat protein